MPATSTCAVREAGGTVVFLHRLEPGGTDRCYGVHVAQLAGLPDAVVGRAREVLHQLEGEHRVVPGDAGAATRIRPSWRSSARRPRTPPSRSSAPSTSTS